MIEERLLFTESNNLNENYKINAEIRMIEEKILFYHQLNQKNEFILFFSKYLNSLAKFGVFYQLVDFFTYYFKFNEKRFFSILVIN